MFDRLEYQREWRKNNREHVKRYAKQYRQEHHEQEYQRRRRWFVQNQDRQQWKDMERRREATRVYREYEVLFE